MKKNDNCRLPSAVCSLPTVVGIIGGGQLGRMMIPYIKQLGMNVVVLDPDPNCPCASISEQIVAPFNCEKGFSELAKKADVITYEFEHIDVELLKKLEKQGATIYPSVASLEIIQDKYTQKQALAKYGPLVDEFALSMKPPYMLKSRKGGYDGKGNFVVKTEADVVASVKALGDDAYMEKLVDFDKEVSVIATRGQDGSVVVYPVSENVHKDSILDVTTVPAKISNDISKKSMSVAQNVLDCFKGVGTFCVELFVTKDGRVLVNEVAPRVHNSGRYTIEACRTSQFENHIRAICGLPLGNADMVVPAALMKNIVGEHFTNLHDVMSHDGVNVHLYGKTEVKPGRKMGHITVTGTEEHIEKVRSRCKW